MYTRNICVHKHTRFKTKVHVSNDLGPINRLQIPKSRF